MKNITLNLMHFVLLFILAMFSVTASAVSIEYRLTTHVDGRTIIRTANLSAGASLETNMPQDLWRGYTTYTYYSDASLTQKITTAPAEDATVYVDYEFDPPFQMSNDSKTVWNYLRNYNPGGTSHRYVYYQKSNGHIYSQKNSPNNSSTSYYYQWAYYGDGYDFQIKSNYGTNNWLVWGGNNSNLQLGSKPEVGWQLYANAASNSYREGGTVSFGIPDTENNTNTNQLAYLEDLGIALKTQNISSDHQFDSHNQLIAVHSGSSSQATMERNNLWSYAFFSSPTSLVPATPDIWHVTYKIQKADGTWYDDIVIQKRPSGDSYNLIPDWPATVTGFTPVDGCEYDYFYTDATFKQQFTGAMPNDRNTTLYIREYTLLSTPWRTLVLPIEIADVGDYFENTVKVLRYTSLDAELTENASETLLSCQLNFTPVNTIEAYHPYLFKADNVKSPLYYELFNKSLIDHNQELYEEKYFADAAEKIRVSMLGVLADDGYEMPQQSTDGRQQNFFFGSIKNGDNYTYKFYRVGATIPQYVCYFYVRDDRSDGSAPIRVSFGTESLSGVSSVIADVKVSNSIYSLDGRKVNASSLDNLKKGIYIINGRKVIK